jgi:hypothetical protein
MVTDLFGEGRLLYHDPKFGRHIDVFLDKLEFLSRFAVNKAS